MAVLGPGGEWIKNKTNEITKGLIQQYQNFTSQSPQQTIGRLNGDGTATLPDGSIVEVVERGTPGLYCILYNMGGGKWLADLPKPRHINVDGQIDPSVYALITVFNQQADPESYIGTSYNKFNSVAPPELRVTYFSNIFGLEGVWLSNLSTESTYQLDPDLYSDFDLTITPNVTEEFSDGSVTPSISTLTQTCPIGPSTAPTEVEGWINSEFYKQYRGEFGPRAYTGPSFILSTECQDILVFQANLETRSTQSVELFGSPGFITSTSTATRDVGGSSLYIKYKILKDIYVDQETGYVRSKSTQSGIYTLPSIFPTFTSSPFIQTGRSHNVVDTTYRATIKLLFNRDENNQPTLGLFAELDYSKTYTVSIITSPTFVTTTQSDYGRRGMIIKSINTSPQIIYNVDLIDYSSVLPSGRPTSVIDNLIYYSAGYYFRGKFTGFRRTDDSVDLFDKFVTLSPLDFLPQQTFLDPDGFNANIITDSSFIAQVDIDFDITNFDFRYATPVYYGVALRPPPVSDLNIVVDRGVFLGYKAAELNDLYFYATYGPNYIGTRLTESSYCFLVPYIGPGSDPSLGNGNNFYQTKKGLATLYTSQDGQEVTSIKMNSKLVDANYLNSVIEERLTYLNAQGERFAIFPFIHVGVGMYKI